jgi:hypothetical protein
MMHRARRIRNLNHFLASKALNPTKDQGRGAPKLSSFEEL